MRTHIFDASSASASQGRNAGQRIRIMDKLRLKSFFGCFTVRTGSLVIGTIGWLGTITASLVRLEYLMKDTPDPTIEKHDVMTPGRISTSALSVVLCVALVFGVYKKRRPFILPWLIAQFLSATVLSFFFCMLLFLLSQESVTSYTLLFMLISGISAGFSWYFFLCVWTYYQEIGEERKAIIEVQIPVTFDPNPPPYSEVVNNNAEYFNRPCTYGFKNPEDMV